MVLERAERVDERFESVRDWETATLSTCEKGMLIGKTVRWGNWASHSDDDNEDKITA